MASHEELRETLDRLRNQIATGAPLADRDREMIDAVLADLTGLIGGESTHESLSQRLRDATDHFEESHPELTFAIGAVAEALSRMGI